MQFQLLDHPLIWNVDWFKVKAGYFAIVDPTDPKEIIYLSQKDFQDMIKVALSNREPLVVLARAGESQPDESVVTAPKPKSPHSPIYFRSFRVYSKFLRALWSDMWEGRLVVPSERNLRYTFCNWSKILLQWLGTSQKSRARSNGLFLMSAHLMHILRHHGALGLTLYLKNSLIVLNKFLSGEPLQSTWDLKFAMRLQGGLPAWFPSPVRKGIRDGSYRTIRLISSLCYLYKGFYAQPVPTISSIFAPEMNPNGSIRGWLDLFQTFLQDEFFPKLFGVNHQIIPTSDQVPPLITSSGPSGGTGISGALRDAWVWHCNRYSGLYASLEVVLGMTGNTAALGFLHHGFVGSDLARQLLPMKVHRKYKRDGYDSVLYDGRKPMALSRLHLITEAAGKVRVIAILDYISQWAFRPMHDLLMTFLSTLSQDATLDQSLGLERFKRQVSSRRGVFHSLDISAATDRIPHQLYEILLGVLCGGYFARHYMRLLRRRNFVTPRELPLDFVKYGRGQPMGALSSFPLLGMVHHAIVQFSAYETNQFPFQDYCIVGDDLVIFDEFGQPPVAPAYLANCKLLGIPINRTKTYSSEHFYNFISRSFLNGIEVTPASVRHELSVHSLGQRIEGALRNIVRWQEGDSRALIPRVSKMLTDHWSWARESVSITGGYVTSYLALLLASVFSPGGHGSRALQVEETGWIYWVASLRGSSIILSHDAMELYKHYLDRHYDETLQVVRTALLALRSELGSSLASFSKIADSYIPWLKKQPRSIRLLFPLFRRDREDYAYWNLSCREVLPLMGYPVDNDLLLDSADYESVTGMSHEELMESYIMELLIYNMGYLVPRDVVNLLRNFYESWTFIFSERPDPQMLGFHLAQAFQAVLGLKPRIDYSDESCLSKVTRDTFGHGPNSSIHNRRNFEYAREGFADRVMHLIGLAWKLLLLSRTKDMKPALALPLPPQS
jgi:hypothetical protein